MPPRLSSVIASLHLKQTVHADTKGFFQAQRHFRRNSGLAVGDIRERCARTPKNSSGARNGQAKRLDNIFPDSFHPDGVGFFMV